MASATGTPVDELRAGVRTVKATLGKTSANQVQADSVKNAAKKLVREYFDHQRAQLQSRPLDDETLSGLDTWFQELLELTQRASLRKRYGETLKALESELNGIEVAFVSGCAGSVGSDQGTLDGKERRIADTLSALVPSAGLSYEQACCDLRDANRRSYRGAAAELREALREALDHLAPDQEVRKQQGFKLQKDRAKPTMKQKVRYILTSRGASKSAAELPENAVGVIEERVGALARSVYTRSSLSTHVGTSRQEVLRVKAYADVVLSELLEIA